MTILKTLRKLGNAHRALNGVTIERGNPLQGNLRQSPMWRDSAPQPHAMIRVERWTFRLKQKI